MQQVLPQIQEQGATLVAVSPQTLDASAATKSEWGLAYRVLSDEGNEAARAFGLVFTVPEYLRPVYEDFGIDLPAANGDETFELPVPATYVIDADGTIRWAHVDVDYRARADPADVVEALKAFD